MKIIAIETMFIFILSMIATIIFILFFFNLKNIIFNFFQEKQPKENFEIEIIEKEKFSKDYLLELSNLCIEKSNKSNLKLEMFVCFYLKSKKNFENIEISESFINTENFDPANNYLLIAYNKKEKIIYLLN